NSKGRKIIGWDEILEGGLAPNATVMSWTGIEGGIAAAKSGHDAIMTPGSHCYFDHYQGDPANEPLAIGGYTPLQKVYGYEPIPATLTAEQGKHILGAQANLWAEYILTTDHVEYMVLPRMLALSEVVWSPKAKRNEADFLRRLPDELAQLKAKGFRYASSLYAVEITPEQGPSPGTIAVKMSCGMPGAIERSCQCIFKPVADHPSGEGTHLTGEERCNQEAVAKGLPCTARVAPYTAPIVLDSDTRVSASLRRENTSRSDRTTRTFRFNKATARPIKLSAAPHERYDDGGAFTLVNGISAQEKRVNHEWLGWRQDVTVTVDLGSVQDISYAGIGALHEVHSWIHAPERIAISTSSDGRTFTPLKTLERPSDAKGRTVFAVERTAKARFVRFVAKSVSKIPDGNAGAGGAAWLFLDEVEVR
ncbi:MAG TPA: family 20 glycosylhydrolase, partial [Flavobacteriales bacterium]